MIVNFLHHLETHRANRPSCCNVRLAAIKSFKHFVEFREPSTIEQVQRILALRPAEIWTHLGLRVQTVRWYLKQVYAKAGIASQTQLARVPADLPRVRA